MPTFAAFLQRLPGLAELVLYRGKWYGTPQLRLPALQLGRHASSLLALSYTGGMTDGAAAEALAALAPGLSALTLDMLRSFAREEPCMERT